MKKILSVFGIFLSMIGPAAAFDEVPGWPIDIRNLSEDEGIYSQEEVVVADVDGDGFQEVAVRGHAAWVDTRRRDIMQLYRYDGSPYPANWLPYYIPGYSRPNYFLYQPLLGDFDLDGIAEIVYGGWQTGMGVRKADGTDLPGWPSPDGDYSSLADVNGDGRLDVVGIPEDIRFPNNRIRLDIRNNDGTPLPGWPVEIPLPFTDYGYSYPPAVGDVDGDGMPNVVLVTEEIENVYFRHTASLVILDHQGNILLNGQIMPGITYAWECPILADMDGDGVLDIIVAGVENPNSDEGGIVYVFRGDGTVLPGWPRQTTVRAPVVVVGDFDGKDGRPELVISSQSPYAYPSWTLKNVAITVMDHQGNTLPGWPVVLSGGSIGIARSPVVGDLDGDGRLEIVGSQVFVNFSGGFRVERWLCAWHDDGTVMNGFPVLLTRGVPSGWQIPPTLTDLDADGYTDVIIPQGASIDGDDSYRKIHAYRMPGKYNPNRMPWPAWRRDSKRSNVYYTP